MSLIRKSASPIGHRRNGSPIWGYSGSAPDDGGTGGDGKGDDGGGDGGDDSGDDDDDGVGDDGLTASGRRAIEAERKAAKRAKDAYKPFAQLARDTGLSVEEMRKRLTESRDGGTNNDDKGTDGKGKDQQVDVEEIRRQVKADVSKASDARFIRTAVKAEAAVVLNDPADALRYLDLSDYDVDDDGEVDQAQVKRDLKKLIEDRPYLAKKKSAADFDGGPRGKGSPTGSMSDVIRRAAGVIR
jgi:hypothetical protein